MPLIAFTAAAIDFALPIILIIFLVKGIKYLNKKNKEKDNHDHWEPL